MSSPRFDRAKQQNRALAPLLDRLMAYLSRQHDSGQTFFIPKLAAAALKLNDGEAYVLLELLTRAGILNRAFNVYCRASGALLVTVDSLEKLDDIPRCDYCDTDHRQDELKVEIAFKIANSENGIRRAT